MNNYSLPKDTAKYITLQRLETQSLGKSIHYSMFGKLAYAVYEKMPFAKNLYRYYSINIEPSFRSQAIIDRYIDIMEAEFAMISPYVGDSLDKVVSIGPGIAGLEMVALSKSQGAISSSSHIYLVDKTGIDPIHFGFHEKAAVYNSLDLAKQVLVSNGASSEFIHLIDADIANKKLVELSGEVDLVTSLIAWGFHFPVSTYVDSVYECLKKGGRLIMDIRKETDGMQVLRSKFDNNVEVIHDDPKFERVLASK